MSNGELIRRARERAEIGCDIDPIESAELLTEAADALEVAARVPVQGEPNDDREALRDEFRSYLGDEIYVCSRDHSAWSHGTMGLDDFSLAAEDDEIVESLVQIAARATVPDAATEQVTEYSHLGYDEASRKEIVAAKLGAEGERDSYKAQYDAATTEMEHLREGVSAWKEGYDLQTAELVKISAERDAATAAIERVRAAVNGPHPANSGLDSFTLAHISAALDGAPEPEWEYGSGPEGALDQSGLHTSRTAAERGVAEWNEFTQRSERMGGRPLERLVLVHRRKAGPWFPVEGESKP